MLQQHEPADYVVATGETHSVQELVEAAFGLLDLDWRDHVRVDPRYYRPAEEDLLQGDASKATAAKGEALFEAATQEIAAYVTELRSLPIPERKDHH
jgi:GDPmannose 4,6-dehydratase